jgi:hypothetical protein
MKEIDGISTRLDMGPFVSFINSYVFADLGHNEAIPA